MRASRGSWRLASRAVLLVLLAAPLAAQEPGAGVVYLPTPIRFVFTGDINLGTRTLEDGIPADSGRELFAAVDTLLRGDLVIGNFEGVLSDSGYSLKCGPPPDSTASDSTVTPRRPPSRKRPRRSAHANCYAFATPTWLAARLPAAGFTHLNLANNHANDFGPDGRTHSEETLRALGLAPYGPIGSIVIQPVIHDGQMTLVGVVGFTTYPHAYNLLDLAGSAGIVDSVRKLADVLVVTFHGGKEGAAAVRTGKGPEFLAREPRGDLRKWARMVIDAGADAVVGHGPHVLRGVEFYRGKPIFYSLGNFMTYRGFNLEGPLGQTTVLQLQLDGDGAFRSARMPALVQIPQVGPTPDQSGEAVKLLQRVTALDFPGTGARIAEDGTITPP
jgi:hypothetical protein